VHIELPPELGMVEPYPLIERLSVVGSRTFPERFKEYISTLRGIPREMDIRNGAYPKPQGEVPLPLK